MKQSSVGGRAGKSSFSHQKVNPYSSRDQVIDLSNQDSGWAMMTCASNSVASIFEETVIGTPNLDRLYDRVSEVVRMNPWLTCRLRMTTSGIKAVYGSEFVDCFQAISRQMKIDIAGKSYSDLVSTLVPYTVKSGESCVDKDEPLFKVTVISGVSKEGPLKQLCLIMSISAVIADARTLYSLFSMMDPDTRPFKLEIARSELYMKTVKQVLGSAQMRWLKSPAMYLGEILKSWTARSQHSAVYTIRNDWIKEKKEQWQGSDVGYVSTNDILTSWFMNLTKCDFGFININFRHLLDLHALQENELLAGRYVHHILLRKPNFETPVAVRNSIPTVENKIKCQPDIPNFMTTIGRNSCLVTNYASISPIVNLPGCTLQLHIPILIKEKDRSFEQYSRWNTSGYFKNEMVIFRATNSTHGILIFGRGVNLDSYLKQKNGPFVEKITSASIKLS